MGNLFAVLLTIGAISFGSLLTYRVIPQTTLPTRVCIGSVVGLAALAWLGFLSALALGLTTLAIGVTAAVLVCGLLALALSVNQANLQADWRSSGRNQGEVLYYSVWAALLIMLFSRVVMFQPDGLHTAPANNYGDLPFHFGVITSFAYGENLPPENPIFAGMRFTYPFLIDFLTAFFIKLGADWRVAFFVENLPLSLALVGLLNFLTYRLTGNRLAARLTPLIFLFNGGLGFLNFFQDLGRATDGWWQFLTHLPHTYTMNAELELPGGKYPLRWGNVFTTLLIPQRSMLFGLPFVALIITLWWMAWGEGELEAQVRKRYLFAAGVLAGALPMLHAHGFFAVMIASALMAVFFFSLEWAAFFLPVALLAAPQAWWLSGTQVKNSLFKLHLWWEAGDSSPFIFWVVNAGVFLSLFLLAMFSSKLSTVRQRRFSLPFVIWFVLPNVVLLAPWAWDNIKVLVYWSLASAPFVAYALSHLFSQRAVFARLLATMMLACLIFSGALDVGRALSPAENTALFSQADLAVAEAIRASTPPRARVLHAPIHNSAVALTGRQSLMGYPGHLWTHGIDYGTRETEVQLIYRGGPTAVDLLAKHNIDFVVIGPVERNQLNADEKYFADNYRKIIDQPEYRVYQIRK
ncbi:MAG: hypothetical protein HYR56_23165 [Acidobacteria bacterium]|nr:hypothetical protein [Acidobacteriota bacterium]MBI3427828.1 hypothetical protein [Acidobacteriota bacterium]